MVILSKTKMCRFFEQGCCNKGYNCSFAHDPAELQQRPNFYKTQLCSTFQRTGKCRDGANCNYAHGKNELRQVAGAQPAFPKVVYFPVMQEVLVPWPIAVDNEVQYDPSGTFSMDSSQMVKMEQEQDVRSSQTTDDEDSSSKVSDDSWSRLAFDEGIEDSKQSMIGYTLSPNADEEDLEMREGVFRAQPSSIWDESLAVDVGISVKKTFLHCDLRIASSRRRSLSCGR